MIEIDAKIHDRYTVEFKVGFVTKEISSGDDFLLGMWVFVPASLDINPETYTKKAFYRYFKSNIRLITPRFDLGEIVEGDALPLNSLLNAGGDYDYQLKMFVSIVKSSVREAYLAMARTAPGPARRESCLDFISRLSAILARYQALNPESRWEEAYRLCGEFLCNVSAEAVFKVMRMGECRSELSALLGEISAIRAKRGYITVVPGDPESNREYIFRHGVVKKYSEEQLYLSVPKTRDGFLAEQAYYSVAAGMAMLFATVVAWAFQRQFGNLTWPLFLALIISYMLKDRIKELMRFYFSHRVGSKYFDNKAEIRHRNRTIGIMKEGMDFVKRSKVPREVRELRERKVDSGYIGLAEDESVMLYREMVKIDRKALAEVSTYRHEGINDIIRLQVQGFLRKADNPVKKVGYLEPDGNIAMIPCEKDYFMNIVLQYKEGGKECYKCFRIMMNRDGIKSVIEI